MNADWFRHPVWNAEVQTMFEARLRRARIQSRAQYLRIQAACLTASQPEVALALLGRYFELPPGVDTAQAYVDQAHAFQALGRIEEAIASYENALARESEFPNALTQAYLEFPYLVATSGVSRHFQSAIEILERYRGRPTFPVERFRWNAARALIGASMDEPMQARAHARMALEAADVRASGLTHHPTLGLVGDSEASVLARVRSLAKA